MPTFRRDKQLRFTLERLKDVRFLAAIIVVWNNIERPIPDDLIPTIPCAN